MNESLRLMWEDWGQVSGGRDSSLWRKWSNNGKNAPASDTYRYFLVSGIKKQADRVQVQELEQEGDSGSESWHLM